MPPERESCGWQEGVGISTHKPPRVIGAPEVPETILIDLFIHSFSAILNKTFSPFLKKFLNFEKVSHFLARVI